MASLAIGKKLTDNSLSYLGDRIEKIAKGKILIRGFVAFQYGRLSQDCRPHTRIFELIAKHGIEYVPDGDCVARTRIGHVSEGKRKFIYERDGGKCVYCESSGPLEPDHIVPRSKGGTDEISNLITACHACNTLKNDKDVFEFIANNQNRNRVLEHLNRVLNTLKEKEQEEENDQEKEGEMQEGGATPSDRITTFGQFWEAYPKRVAKGDAEKAWAKKECHKILPLILVKIRELKISEDWTKEAGKFIPHPATWLNREGWHDELPEQNGTDLHTTKSRFGF